MWLEKRSRLLKGDFCAVCVRRSAQSTGARSADVRETGELCAQLAPATPTTGASAAQDVETAPRARAAPQVYTPDDWSTRDKQPKYFRGAERSGHSRWRKQQGDCACNKVGASACRCPDAAVLARLAGGGKAGASEPVPSLKGGVSGRSTRRAASASAKCQESLGRMLSSDHPLGALALGAKGLAKKLAPAPASHTTAASASAASASTRSGATATRAQLRLAALQSAESAAAADVQASRAALGEELMGVLGKMEAPEERRPLLAAVIAAGVTHPQYTEAGGVHVTTTEWAEAGKHHVFPGAFAPVPKVQRFRQRVKTSTLVALLRFIEGSVQQLAFGRKLLLLLNGTEFAALDNVMRLQKVHKLVREFLTQLDSEAQAADSDTPPPADGDRCTHVGAGGRRCRCARDHTGNHELTPPGSISAGTVDALIRTLTGGDLLSLAGLDECSVLQGRDNFIRLRKLLCCRAECPETRRKCEFTTQQKARFEAHVSGRVGQHTWVQRAGHGGSGVNASDVIVRLAAAAGGALAAGTNPDRMGSDAVEPTPVAVLAAGAAAACCAGKFLKPEHPKPYKKPQRLVQELEALYAVGESDDASAKNLSAREMRQRMAAMRDSDGTLFFCWAKRGTRIAPSDNETLCSMCGKNACVCNGALLTVGQVQAFINTATQKRKKSGT